MNENEKDLAKCTSCEKIEDLEFMAEVPNGHICLDCFEKITGRVK